MSRATSLTLSGASVVLLCVWLTVCGEGKIPHHRRVADSGQNVKIRLSLSPMVSSIRTGEYVRLKVELWNEGPENIFVCRDFEKPFWPLCHTAIFLQDSSGTHASRVLSAPDFSPWQKQSLSAILWRDWISLPPEHAYGATITIDAREYPELQKPGLYQIVGRYSSGGLIAGYQNTVSFEADEFSRLQATSWEGEIESAPVKLQVRGGQ